VQTARDKAAILVTLLVIGGILGASLLLIVLVATVSGLGSQLPPAF